MLATKTTNKAACATCVCAVTFHENRSGLLVYVYRNGVEVVVGVAKDPEDGRSTRFYCLDHADRREGL